MTYPKIALVADYTAYRMRVIDTGGDAEPGGAAA